MLALPLYLSIMLLGKSEGSGDTGSVHLVASAIAQLRVRTKMRVLKLLSHSLGQEVRVLDSRQELA